MERDPREAPEDVPDLSDDEDDVGDDDDEWTEIDESDENLSVECLFCPKACSDVDSALDHCKAEHGFDLPLLKAKHRMDFYSYVKLVGFARTRRPDASAIMSAARPIWDDELYLKPVRHEPWLTYDFDSLDDLVSGGSAAASTTFHANVENGLVTLSEAHFSELQRTIQGLQASVKDKDDQLRIFAENMARMQAVMQSVVAAGGGKEPESNHKKNLCVGSMDVDEDGGYFGTYAHFSIHHDMLSDRIRTDSYRDALLKNGESIGNKIVLDLGCGTGILSMFSASAGASKVYAIDQSDIIYHAMDIIRENKLDHRINIIKGRVEDTTLPEKVDVIVSEWMGYFLLFEGMLDSVVHARDHWLKPGGLMMPNRCTISIVGSGDVETHSKLIGFWSDVYGFKMNCMKKEVVREASIDVADSAHTITSPALICDLNMYTCTTDSVNFSAEFNLDVLRDGHLTFLVGYFDTFFDLPNPVSFSTGPDSTTTHWKQTIFYLKEPIPVRKGSVLSGKFVCNRNVSDLRGLVVNITMLNKTYKYILN